MNIRRLISTPAPDTVWHLDQRMVAVVHRNRRGEDQCGATALPPETFEVGPVGLQAVDREHLRAVLVSLRGRSKDGRRPGVVIPTAWVRTFLLEGEDLPRRQGDLEDVVRWRLKKLLPGAPPDVRLVATLQPEWKKRRQALCVTVPGKALTDLEGAFGEIGVVPGLILPRLFALSLDSGANGSSRLVVQQEESMFSLLLVVEGGVRLVRTKLLSGTGDEVSGMDREIHLGLTYIREELGCTGRLEAVISTVDGEVGAAVKESLSSVQDIEAALYTSQSISDPTLAGLVGSARLAPMAAVLSGGAP